MEQRPKQATVTSRREDNRQIGAGLRSESREATVPRGGREARTDEKFSIQTRGAQIGEALSHINKRTRQIRRLVRTRR
eukprot:164619-Pyramimonas_sp.AAC.1